MQYPDSSQGYNRYTYVGNNPLSLSDPSGYFAGNQYLGVAAAIAVTVACEGTCGPMTTAFLAGATEGYISSGGNLNQAGISGLTSMTYAVVGAAYSESPGGVAMFDKSVTEGLIGGAFSEAGGGRFSDGFIGSFMSSMTGPYIDQIDAGDYSASAIASREVVRMFVGGTSSELSGGSFTVGAVSAAMQGLYNDEHDRTEYSDFKKALTTFYPGFEQKYPLEYKLWLEYASQYSTDIISYNTKLEFDAYLWKGFDAYARAHALDDVGPELRGTQIDSLGGGLVESFLSEPFNAIFGFGDLGTLSDANSTGAMIKEGILMKENGPQVINEATFEYLFDESYSQLIPNN